MKKFLAIVAFAAFMTSCNDSSTTEATSTDSTTVPTATVAASDSAVITTDSVVVPKSDSAKVADSLNKK